MSVSVCIIGAGSIGLSLLFPWMRAEGHDPVLIARASRRAVTSARLERIRRERKFIVRMPDGDRSFDGVTLIEYDAANLEGVGSEAAIDALSTADVVLVSVGVGNLGDVAQLVATALRRRGGTKPLHVLAFENRHRASLELARQIDRLVAGAAGLRPVMPHVTVTDRACQSTGAGGTADVEAESYGEVVIADSARAVIGAGTRPASTGPVVTHVSDQEMELFEDRKYWFVNGTHVVLGLRAYDRGAAGFRLVDALDADGNAALLRSLHEEWIAVLAARAARCNATHPALTHASIRGYADRMFDRLRELPTWTVLNVLRELQEHRGSPREDVLARVARLLEKLDGRLASQILSGGLTCVPTPRTGLALAGAVRTIAREEW